MKPFLFLATRADDDVADQEYEAVLRGCGLDEPALRRVRLERDELGQVDLADWSGVILGGSPFNISDPVAEKSDTQRRVEHELAGLAARVVAADFPFLGACYGIGTLGTLAGGEVDRRFGEPVGPVEVTLCDAGREDRLLGVLPASFQAFVGHKEAVAVLPHGAVLLASSATCPVQAFRIGQHVYATQFHPELDVPGLLRRAEVYRHHGYFPPEELQAVQDRARGAVVTEPARLLARFAELYAA